LRGFPRIALTRTVNRAQCLGVLTAQDSSHIRSRTPSRSDFEFCLRCIVNVRSTLIAVYTRPAPGANA